MIEIVARAEANAIPQEWLQLPFELRQKSRLRTRLESGEDAWLMLPRGEILRGGDVVRATDGRTVGVIARPEQLLHVTCETPQALARVAYHLGNRHVPVEVGAGYLRLAFDHVLENMVRGLGANVSVVEEPFEPEAGAYAGHIHSDPSTALRTGTAQARIHEYGRSRDE